MPIAVHSLGSNPPLTYNPPIPSLSGVLYEELITGALEARLQQVGARLHTRRRLLHEALCWRDAESTVASTLRRAQRDCRRSLRPGSSSLPSATVLQQSCHAPPVPEGCPFASRSKGP